LARRRLPRWFPLSPERLVAGSVRTQPRVVLAFLTIIVVIEVVRWVAPEQLRDTMIVTLGSNLFEGGQLAPWRIYSLFTSWAVHGGVLHMAFNALWVLAFGAVVHRHLGSIGFAVFFLLTSAAGSLAAALVNWGQTIYSIGASGSVFGLLGAGAYLMTGGGTVPRKLAHMVLFVVIFQGLNILFAMVGGAAFGVEGRISWEAHAGGMAAGLVLFPILASLHAPRRPPPKII
jgi:membrane associated rhomboid family serine protease